jgi:valyl-tRNA synthetase
MPFLTEELWHKLPQPADARSIALDTFPEVQPSWTNPAAEAEMALLQSVIGAARNLRAESKVDAKEKLEADFFSTDNSIFQVVRENCDAIQRLAGLAVLRLATSRFDATGGAIRTTAQFDLRVIRNSHDNSPSETSIGADAERARLGKEIDRLSKDVESKRARLADAQFRSRAPAAVVAGVEATLAERRTELEKVSVRLSEIGRH